MPRTSATVRRLPLPASEPPYDDELPVARDRDRATASTQGTLALAFALPGGVPAVPTAPAPLRLVPTRAEDDSAPRPTSRRELPDPRVWAGRLSQAVLEVLSGDRPVAQLVRWTSAEVYADLQRRVVVAARIRPPHLRDGCRAAVRSVHVCEPEDGVAEVTTVVARSARTSAVALRLEGLDGRWRCTALELG
jgi:hypothetical protein